MPQKFVAAVKRAPFAIVFTLALLAVGIISGSLIRPATEAHWFSQVATGIPTFAEGRWWSPFTSVFFVGDPWVYLFVVPLVLGSVAWAEWRFGTLRTMVIFVGGHLVGVFGAAVLVWLLALAGSTWATKLSQDLDVGPSCGAIATLVFAIATLPSPWRLRARALVIVWVVLSMLYLGQLYDVEHAVSMVAALTVSGLLPAFRRPGGRPTEREWRFLAFGGLITVGAMQVFDLAVPIDGPLGTSHPIASSVDVAIDIVVILLVANGIRQGLRIAWIATLVLAAFNLVGAIALISLLPLLVELGAIDHARDVRGLIVAPTVLWIGQAFLLVIGRGAWRVRLRYSARVLDADPASPEHNERALTQHGGGTISWMTTWPLNSHVQLADGTAAFQSHAGVAIMLSDPIVSPDRRAESIEQFASAAQRAGLIPAMFSVGQSSFEACPPEWRSLIVAEDTVVDLPGLAFTGKPWAAVRAAINKAGREGITFRMTRLVDEPRQVVSQVRRISEQWTGDKSLPEMKFTLGTVQEALDPQVMVGLAFNEAGEMQGVTSWLPVYGSGDHAGEVVGWTLDVMRRADDGFSQTMEFLIASSMKHFSEQGAQFMSLSGAPFIHPDDRELTPVDQVLTRIGELIEPVYGFKSLHRFKQKFNPRAEPLYLLFRDEGDLPRIGIALTRAYLPDASLRDLVASAAPTQPAKVQE
jgi:phosphatidylglycerol lysyltransferase